MLDKMSANQRLILAAVLSIVFFVGYSAIVPSPKIQEEKTSKTKELNKSHIQTQEAQTQEIDILQKASGHKISEVDKIASDESSVLTTITHKNFILKIDTLGRISSKELLEEKYNDADGRHAQLIPPSGVKPLFIRFLDTALNKESVKIPYTVDVKNIELDSSSRKIILTQKLSDLTIVKELTFYPDGHYDALISLSKNKRYYIYLGERPQVTEQLMTVAGAMIYNGDDITTIIEDGDAEHRMSFSDVKLISAFDQYAATIMYGFAKDTNIIVEKDKEDNPVLYFDALPKTSFSGYIGQKEYKVLKNIKPILTNAIEYGWFTFASKPLFALLSWLHGVLGNWGWSIVALTFIIRTVLYPLTYKGMVSMQKIKEISPKIKELQAKHKGDPQKMNASVMEMYKKHGANPLGGCLPMLLQIPVFFAIYRVLLNAVELQGAEWILWIDDLSRMDNFYVLPILMGISMYYQQKMTPNNFTDPMQEKIFKFLPVIFTFFFITFPSGLVLYWFINNIFSIIQQFIVNQQFKNKKDAEIALHKKSDK